MVKDFYHYHKYIETIYGIKITDEERVIAISQYVLELQKSAQYRVCLTAIVAGGLSLCVGIVIGKLWFGT